MKALIFSSFAGILLLCSFITPVNNRQANSNLKTPLSGSWMMEKGQQRHVLLFTNKHYSYTIYNLTGKKFHHTEGGTYTFNGNKLNTSLEFNSSDASVMGKKSEIAAQASASTLQTDWPEAGSVWKRTDEGGGNLNATWRITGRDQGGKMNTIEKSARKTIKLLTGNRFQWAAINTATGEFFGTGGGTYTFKDGRYTEQIEFFSRDSSRVGMSLSFEGKVEGDNWHHRGKSSKGDPIYEIWSRED